MGNQAGRGGGTWRVSGSGNQINTGDIRGDQVYMGSAAPNPSPELQAAQSKLAELIAALEQHATSLRNPDIARSAAARIDEELTSPTPDRRRLTETLETLGLAIGSVTAVVTVAKDLASAITALFT